MRNKENEHVFQAGSVLNYKQSIKSNRFQCDSSGESYWKQCYLKRYPIDT